MRVILVDPSRTVLKYVTRMLEARRHEVIGFTNARVALQYLADDQTVGALISSCELIEMSGFELCWEARLIASCRRPIYLILMSTNQERRKTAEALDSGADDFIGKPPVAEELYARLRVAERLDGMQRELLRLATIDPLTGVLNRRAFFEQANEACANIAANHLAVVMIDIDCFKHINDVHGHDVGDLAIRGVAEVVAQGGRIVGRLGGEEFVFVTEGRALPEAASLAETLRSKIALLRFPTSTGVLSLTCSFGVSDWEPGDRIEDVLKRADVALYAAKSDGRNRVMVAEDRMFPVGSREACGLDDVVSRDEMRPAAMGAADCS